MTLSSAARVMISKISAWWLDHQDEHLDEFIAQEYQQLNSDAENSGITAYQLVNRARKSSGES